MATRTHYELLGVDADATTVEIKAAYRKVARSVHPDVPGGNAALFGVVTEAYEVLADEQRRAGYDLSLRAPSNPPTGEGSPSQGRYTGEDEDEDDAWHGDAEHATRRQRRTAPEDRAGERNADDDPFSRAPSEDAGGERFEWGPTSPRHAWFVGRLSAPVHGLDLRGRKRTRAARLFRPYVDESFGGWKKPVWWSFPVTYLAVFGGYLLRQSPVGEAWFPNPDVELRRAGIRRTGVFVPPQGWDFSDAFLAALLLAPLVWLAYRLRKSQAVTSRIERWLLLALASVGAFAGEDLIRQAPLSFLWPYLLGAYLVWVWFLQRVGPPRHWAEAQWFPAWWQGRAAVTPGLRGAVLARGVHARAAVRQLGARLTRRTVAPVPDWEAAAAQRRWS